jgi:hypothetical protein
MVILPAPFEPSNAKISPAPHLEINAFQRVHPVKGFRKPST